MGSALAQTRIHLPVDRSQRTLVRGVKSPRARALDDSGPVAASFPMQGMKIIFRRSNAQQAALDKLLLEQQDPTSANFHKWLAPEEYADRFGVRVDDLSTLRTWLISEGFTIDATARPRLDRFLRNSSTGRGRVSNSRSLVRGRGRMGGFQRIGMHSLIFYISAAEAGTWQVRVFHNGSAAFTLPFTISTP
jgi:hypothetical protein